jgi:hypothetical protein
MGADPGKSTNDPKVKELVDEIVRLSTEFGILTEYTAFLAREGTDLSNREELLSEASESLERRAMRTRSGISGVNQGFNLKEQKDQVTLNVRNAFYDPQMNRVSIANVQQINDRAYYQRGNRWVDSRLVNEEEDKVKSARIIEFGSEEFMEIAEKLAKENRQGSIALNGNILLLVDGEPILIRNRTDTTANK